MDPNATLATLRAAVIEWEQAVVAGDEQSQLDAARRTFEALTALDDWLSSGGFLPTAWRTNRTYL
jgi:hypothetical protein